MNKLALAAALLASALPCSVVQANDEEPRWFEIEVIAFARTIDADATGEDWPNRTQPAPQDRTKQLDLLSPLLQISPAEPGTEAPVTCDSAEPDCSHVSEPLPVEYLAQLPVPALNAQLPATDSAPYLLGATELQLSDKRDQLARRPEFRVLSHFGWRQVVEGKHLAFPVRIFGGRDFAEQFNADGSPRPAEPLAVANEDAPTAQIEPFTLDESESAQSDMPSVEATQLEPATQFDDPLLAIAQQAEPEAPAATRLEPVWELDGDIAIHLDHYLYADVNLRLRQQGERELQITESDAPMQTPQLGLSSEPLTDTNADAPEGGVEVMALGDERAASEGTLVASQGTEPFLFSYQLSEPRRLRSTELHYFDHPLMGLLVQIRTYEPRALPLPEPELGAAEAVVEAEPALETSPQ